MKEYKNKKIGITGYKGYLGSALYHKLKKIDCDLTCLACTNSSSTSCTSCNEANEDFNLDLLLQEINDLEKEEELDEELDLNIEDDEASGRAVVVGKSIKWSRSRMSIDYKLDRRPVKL